LAPRLEAKINAATTPVAIGRIDRVGKPHQGIAGFPTIVQPGYEQADVIGDHRWGGTPRDPDCVGDRLAGSQCRGQRAHPAIERFEELNVTWLGKNEQIGQTKGERGQHDDRNQPAREHGDSPTHDHTA
jgi:hypothetical protein